MAAYSYLVHRLSKVFRPSPLWGEWAPVFALCWLEAMIVVNTFFVVRKLLGDTSHIANPYTFGVLVTAPVLIGNALRFRHGRIPSEDKQHFARYSPRQQIATDLFLVTAFGLALGLPFFWAPQS